MSISFNFRKYFISSSENKKGVGFIRQYSDSSGHVSFFLKEDLGPRLCLHSFGGRKLKFAYECGNRKFGIYKYTHGTLIEEQ